MAIVVSAFYVSIQDIKYCLGILTIIYLLRRGFRGQFVFSPRYVCEVGEFFRRSYNHKLIEVCGSYDKRFASESV